MMTFSSPEFGRRHRRSLLALLIGTSAALSALTACESEPVVLPPEPPASGASLDLYSETAIEDGIIRERTIYPHYFVANSTRLNDLGLRAVHVLGRSCAERGGRVSIVQGDADDQLYADRIDVVVDAMVVAGTDRARLVVDDEPAGGQGMPSGTVLEILAGDDEGTAPATVMP
jgi:hypothetical protein